MLNPGMIPWLVMIVVAIPASIPVAAAPGVGVAQARDLPPDKMVSGSWDLYRQAKQEKESVKIVVSYSDGRREEKKGIRWTRFDPSHEDCVTIKFLAPPLDRGLGLLTFRHADRDDEQWLKLPSLKKVRKIAAGEQEKYFAGTDMTNEDIRQLIGERVKDFSYTLVRRESDSSIVEAVPRAGIETGYGRRLMWIDGRSAITRVEYYGKNGEQIKVQTHSGITVSGNGMWRINHIEIDNLLLERKTLLDVEEREIDGDISPDVFAKDFLESERM